MSAKAEYGLTETEWLDKYAASYSDIPSDLTSVVPYQAVEPVLYKLGLLKNPNDNTPPKYWIKNVEVDSYLVDFVASLYALVNYYKDKEVDFIVPDKFDVFVFLDYAAILNLMYAYAPQKNGVRGEYLQYANRAILPMIQQRTPTPNITYPHERYGSSTFMFNISLVQLSNDYSPQKVSIKLTKEFFYD